MKTYSSAGIGGLAMAKKGRRPNSSCPYDMVKVLRSHMPSDLDTSDPEHIVANYEDVISEANQSLVWQDVKVSEADTWAERICKAVSFCYQKRLRVTTFVRLTAPVRGIILQIKKNSFKYKKDPAQDPRRECCCLTLPAPRPLPRKQRNLRPSNPCRPDEHS